MGKGFRQGAILLLLMLVTFIYLNGTRIFSPPGVNSNLSNLNYFGVGNTWNSMLFGDNQRWSSMQHYVSLRDEYEYRRNYGLLDSTSEAQYMGRFSDLAQNAFQSWQTYHIRSAGKWASQEADEYFGLESLKQSRSPVLLLGILAAAYAGKTLRYRLGEDNQLEAKTVMTNSKFNQQYVGWKNASLDASAGATYGADRRPAFNVRKNISREVSVNYERSSDHAVGVSYSTGF